MVMPFDWPLVKTSLGLTQDVYTPHVMRVAFEANYAATNDNIADVNTWAHMLPIIGAALAKGTKVEVYVETNGTRGAESEGSIAYGGSFSGSGFTVGSHLPSSTPASTPTLVVAGTHGTFNLQRGSAYVDPQTGVNFNGGAGTDP